MLDDELTIETPERVDLHFVLASVGNRFLAAFIDHIIQIVTGLVVLLIAVAFNGWALFESMGVWAAALTVLAIAGIYWGYFVAFETIWSGQTPGKRIMKLRVVREDGRPVRFFEVFVRNVLRVAVDIMPASYAIGVVSIIFSERSKRIGDFVAGTVVVKERATEAPSLTEITRLFEAEQRRVDPGFGLLGSTDTRRLSETEVRAIETFLNRRFELGEPSRSALAMRIAQPVLTRLGIPPGSVPAEQLLEEVARQHRIQSRFVE